MTAAPPAETAAPKKRSLPPVMRITDAAAERLRDILSSPDAPGIAVRVGVEKGGCAGMSYTMDYTHEIGPYDSVVEDKGVKLVVDPSALMFLLGTEMDFKTDKMSSQFVFNNPNQTSACGCGVSVEIAPASPEALSKAGA